MMSRLAAIGLLVAATAGTVNVTSATRDPNTLVVHEWGTFTTIAGEDGDAVEWWTVGGPQDLPCFVERLKNGPKANLVGTVRMETPVLYFYSPRETKVDVTVRFHRGSITEWFPRAAAPPLLTSGTHTLTWSDVMVLPRSTAAFPQEPGPSHYYAARATDAAPVQVGAQHEKFLFYRGVGRFPIPVRARIASNGQIVVTNKGTDPLPAVILFENRGGQLRYHQHGAIAGDRDVALALRANTADLDPLTSALERLLISHGLYAKEAQAMIETWRDSWFEEGTRLIYIVPQATIDGVLPLSMKPQPTELTRVFVGRVELLTTATLADVSAAIARNEPATAFKYGRFLPTIVDRLLPPPRTPSQRAQADRALTPWYGSTANKPAACASAAGSTLKR